MLFTEILNGIKTFFQTHLQVNTVVVGSEFDLNAIDDAHYVAVLIDPSNGQKNGNMIDFEFKIVIADKVLDNDVAMASTVQNNAIAIANDLTNYVESDLADGVLDYGVTSYDLFHDRYDSRTAGIVYNLRLTTDNSSNTCLSMNPIVTGQTGTGAAQNINVQSTDEINMSMDSGTITATINEQSLSYTKYVTAQTLVVIPYLEHLLETVSTVQVYDIGGTQVLAQVAVDFEKNVIATFQIPFSGRIVLSV